MQEKIDKGAPAAIRWVLNDAGVSVRSRTNRRRLSYVGLKGGIPRKKPFFQFTTHKKKGYRGQKSTLIGQMISDHR